MKVEGTVFSVAAKCKNFELSAIRLIGSSYYVRSSTVGGIQQYVTAGWAIIALSKAVMSVSYENGSITRLQLIMP